MRDDAFIGGAYGRQRADGLAGIAVPLMDGKVVHGVINIIWAKAARTTEDMVKDHLRDLQQAAADIVATLRQQRSGWPR